MNVSGGRKVHILHLNLDVLHLADVFLKNDFYFKVKMLHYPANQFVLQGPSGVFK